MDAILYVHVVMTRLTELPLFLKVHDPIRISWEGFLNFVCSFDGFVGSNCLFVVSPYC